MSLTLAVTDFAHATLVAVQAQAREAELEIQREEWKMERERWDRERERERIDAHARGRFGGVGWLLLLAEKHRNLIINLISIYAFYKIVMKLIDCRNFGFDGLAFNLLILVSLRIFLFRAG